MKEDVQIKLLAYRKGTPPKKIRILVKEMEAAYKKIMPEVTLCIIPVEMDFNALGTAEKT